MVFAWSHAVPSITAAFFASLVEFVEAFTVILAVGSVRGWREAFGGGGVALILLLTVAAALGPALARIPLTMIQTIVGALLLLFGLRWLRKAILRAVGIIPLHDETAVFAKETARLHKLGGKRNWDTAAFAASFQITLLEGMEVIFVVLAIGTGGPGLFLPASIGALMALLVVMALGLLVHRPLANVPENTLKFGAGILLSAFGTFWLSEGLGMPWPGGDWAILSLTAGFLIVALLTTQVGRTSLARAEIA